MNLGVRIAQLHFTFVHVDTFCAAWYYASPVGGHYNGGKGAGRFQFDILSVDIGKNIVNFVCLVALFMAVFKHPLVVQFAMKNVEHNWCWDKGNAIQCHGSKANSFNNDNDMKFTWTNEYDKK